MSYYQVKQNCLPNYGQWMKKVKKAFQRQHQSILGQQATCFNRVLVHVRNQVSTWTGIELSVDQEHRTAYLATYTPDTFKSNRFIAKFQEPGDLYQTQTEEEFSKLAIQFLQQDQMRYFLNVVFRKMVQICSHNSKRCRSLIVGLHNELSVRNFQRLVFLVAAQRVLRMARSFSCSVPKISYECNSFVTFYRISCGIPEEVTHTMSAIDRYLDNEVKRLVRMSGYYSQNINSAMKSVSCASCETLKTDVQKLIDANKQLANKVVELRQMICTLMTRQAQQ